MSIPTTRRQFLTCLGGAAAGAALGVDRLLAAVEDPGRSGPRVVIARDEALTGGKPDEHGALLRKLLDAAMQKLTAAPDAATAWRQLFTPKDRIGLKVNTLGLTTQPVVVDAIVVGLRQAGVPAENIIIWDRFDSELSKAGYKLNKSGSGVQCRGTDAERVGSGYQEKVETSGQIGSSFSKIIAEDVDVVISVPVLKDHNLAGVTLGMKNFYGAIHNPNKYHDQNCDPYIVDVVSHRFIAKKWRLTICDGVRAQYNGGPAAHPGFAWPFGGLLVGRDFVAVDAVGADLLDARRKEAGMKSLAEENRPPKYLATAVARGLGEADLRKIERIEV
jgi:uncharacterized protein (DUF362 family)